MTTERKTARILNETDLIEIHERIEALETDDGINQKVYTTPSLIGATFVQFDNFTSTFTSFSQPVIHHGKKILAVRVHVKVESDSEVTIGFVDPAVITTGFSQSDVKFEKSFLASSEGGEYLIEFPEEVDPVSITSLPYFQFCCYTTTARMAPITNAVPGNDTPIQTGNYTSLDLPSRNFYTTSANASVKWAASTTSPRWVPCKFYDSFEYVKSDSDSSATGTELNKAVEMSLPQAVYGIVGEPCELFYNSIANVKNANDYHFEMTTGTGRNTRNIWQHTPAATGNASVAFDLYDDYGNKLKSVATTFKASNGPVNPATQKNLLMIGDSLTNADTWVTELQRRLCGTGGTPVGKGLINVTFIGTRGTAPAKHEGRGGWTVKSYLEETLGNPSSPNPFWDTATSKNNFTKYCSSNGYARIDYVLILLGWNELFSGSTITDMKTLTGQLKTEYAAVKIGLVGLQPPSYDGIGVMNNLSWRWRNISKLVDQKNSGFESLSLETGYKDFVSFIPVKPHFDVSTGYPTVEEVNHKRDSTLVTFQNNHCHPNTTGYLQIADAVYAAISNLWFHA